MYFLRLSLVLDNYDYDIKWFHCCRVTLLSAFVPLADIGSGMFRQHSASDNVTSFQVPLSHVTCFSPLPPQQVRVLSADQQQIHLSDLLNRYTLISPQQLQLYRTASTAAAAGHQHLQQPAETIGNHQSNDSRTVQQQLLALQHQQAAAVRFVNYCMPPASATMTVNRYHPYL